MQNPKRRAKFRFNPYLRVVIFIPLLIFAGTCSWGYYAHQHFSPIRCVVPFSKYLIDRFILRRGDAAKYRQVLEVFIDVRELRSLAVPHDKGGPVNQQIFVVEGFALLLSLFLIAFPLSGVQVIGFIISVSSALGYAISMQLFEGVPLLSQQPGQFVCMGASFLGILSILL